MTRLSSLCLPLLAAATACSAWVVTTTTTTTAPHRTASRLQATSQQVDAAGSPIAESKPNPVIPESPQLSKVERFLEKKYPAFTKYLLTQELRQVLRSESEAVTVFVPNQDAFDALGDKKIRQLVDPRNAEIAAKVAAHHVVPGEALSATQLLTEDYTTGRPKPGAKANTVIAKVKAYGNVEVPVGRKVTKSGGFLSGIFQEGVPDGDVVIGPDAIIVQSFLVGNETMVHEMSGLVSPVVLWRYFDQLRIPGL